mmetsp:Transcript_12128/g.52291  ORF Transcript_12128/g.52291 Transcript_12128/m.52291 type:complete len:262 (-) Transcript_12128:8-793(-)
MLLGDDATGAAAPPGDFAPLPPGDLGDLAPAGDPGASTRIVGFHGGFAGLERAAGFFAGLGLCASPGVVGAGDIVASAGNGFAGDDHAVRLLGSGGLIRLGVDAALPGLPPASSALSRSISASSSSARRVASASAFFRSAAAAYLSRSAASARRSDPTVIAPSGPLRIKARASLSSGLCAATLSSSFIALSIPAACLSARVIRPGLLGLPGLLRMDCGPSPLFGLSAGSKASADPTGGFFCHQNLPRTSTSSSGLGSLLRK